MRTPGSELELALGFLYTEGIIRGPSEVASAKLCADDPNVAEVVLRQHYAIESRNFYTTSSCGVCGKASIDSVKVHSHHDVSADPMTVRAATLSTLPDKLRQAQRGFARTGGSHAAGVFTANGDLLLAREDVGRHNAFDKAIGTLLQRGRRPADRSRDSRFRAGQLRADPEGLGGGSARAGRGFRAEHARGRPGRRGRHNLVGFLRGESMNIYTRPDRVN